jgi:large subunit ribosomal protein L32
MAVPKKKTTSRRSKLRRSHDGLTATNLSVCKKCGEPLPSHIACSNCGYYGDKKVLDVETKLDKKLRKEAKKTESKKEE